MIEVEVQLKKWGNSIGAVFPKDQIEKEKFKEGQTVKIIVVPKTNPLKETFGTLKFSKPTERLLKEVDRELWND